MGAEGDLVAPRLARGCRCFTARLGSDVAGYGWLSRRPEWIGEVGLEIAPAAGEAYVWNCVTLAPHRLKGVFGALLVFIATQARADGLSRLWIASLAGTAEKAVLDAGFRPVLRLDVVSLPWFRRLSVSPAPRTEPRLVAAALQALSVRTGSSLHRRRARRH